MEPKFKIGDLIVSKNRKPDAKVLVLRIFDINPPEFKGMYALGRVTGKIATTYKNIDYINNNCDLATPAMQVLFGSK